MTQPPADRPPTDQRPGADDDDLRSIVRGAVSGVRPSSSLDEIQRRTAQQPNRSRTWLAAIAAAALVAGTVGVIATVVHTSPVPTDTARPNPTSIPTNSRPSGPAQPRNVEAGVYFVGDTVAGPRLFREKRTYEGLAGWSDLRVAVVSAVIGDTSDPDYRSVFPRGTSANVSTGDGVATVDLTGDARTLARPPDATSGQVGLQAVVWTVDGTLGSDLPVQFRINGDAAAQVLGVDTSHPVQKADADAIEAPVSIATPGNESSVASPFTVTGMAATFEANVQWELKDGSRVVKQGFTTAGECCTLSPYTFEVTAPPGRYTLVVHDSDESGSGRPVDQDSKTVVVE
jgi:hypothetical protein